MAPVRVAVAGAGHYARFHLAAWARLPDAAPVAIADPDRARADVLATRFGVPGTFADAAAMIDAVRPDLLDIVVPPAGQADLIALAADRGIDAICQKPFCTSLAEAEAAVARAEAAGIRLVVHENFRFQPWYRAIAAALDAGRIGEPLQLSFRHRPGDGQGPDAYLARQPYFRTMPRFLLRETGIHFIDTFRFLFGEIAAVTAEIRRLNPAIAGEDAAILVLDFANGRRGLYDGNRLLDHAADDPRLTHGTLLLEGTEGSLRLSGDGRVHHRRRGAAGEEALAVTIDTGADATGGGSVAALQAHVVGHLRTGAPLENSARDYLANLRVEAAAYESAARGCRITLA